ncbi:hypothetical protein MYSTI_02417 [Myxococcus stipitatus DSM 14675]|uniref:Uncharacterized protein n=1 Tax=Myxococcus stipitatus (strain DSM 14675 / JCM 12634 / Mx s8) TaxID=1278073 RepID=L7U6I2_MYXSD|nr:hypothetical protein [Myxococcus stipitatus]AGC43733.1 hypothetical protein MYSTI_02417 [Myxococcus stipitatus DSM 14675]
MRLTALAEFELSYTWMEYLDFAPGGQYLAIVDGAFTGERLAGEVRFLNVPVKRPDNVNMPALKGVLTTSSGAKVFVEMAGVSLLRAVDAARVCTASVLFRSANADFAWLNNAFGLMEGVLDASNTARGRIFLCENTVGLDDSPAHGR